MNDIPQSIMELVDKRAAMRGTVAVVMGGSRAVRSDDEGSDWDLGVYYRDEVDLTSGSSGSLGSYVFDGDDASNGMLS